MKGIHFIKNNLRVEKYHFYKETTPPAPTPMFAVISPFFFGPSKQVKFHGRICSSMVVWGTHAALNTRHLWTNDSFLAGNKCCGHSSKHFLKGGLTVSEVGLSSKGHS